MMSSAKRKEISTSIEESKDGAPAAKVPRNDKPKETKDDGRLREHLKLHLQEAIKEGGWTVVIFQDEERTQKLCCYQMPLEALIDQVCLRDVLDLSCDDYDVGSELPETVQSRVLTDENRVYEISLLKTDDRTITLDWTAVIWPNS